MVLVEKSLSSVMSVTKTFSSKDCSLNHYRIHRQEKPFKCRVCGKAFSYKGCLLSHNRTHSEEKPFKCDVCDKDIFLQRSHLTIVIKELTVGEKPYKCDVCDKDICLFKVHLKKS